MTRLLRSASVTGALLLAVAVAGCGSPAPSTQMSPTEILNRSLDALQADSSVHVDGTLDGSVDAGTLARLAGYSLPLSGMLRIDGATVVGDVDIARQAFHLTATFPSLFGFSEEIIMVDGYLYTKTNQFGDKFHKTAASTSGLQPGASPGATLTIEDALGPIRSFVATGSAAPTLVRVESIGGRDAYHLTVIVPASTVNQVVGSILGPAASGITFEVSPVDYWVNVDTYQPAQIEIKATSTSLGHIDFTATLSRWNDPVQIAAPPASELAS